LVFAALPASAKPPSGYGFDNNAHLIVGGGSDTTYKAMVNITDLYNGSVGCEVTTATGATINKCITPVRTTAADGNTTNGGTAITSATANFTANDVGANISGAGIPASTTIASVTNATTADLSANATATATTTVFTISDWVETNTLGNYERDTVAQANPTGSSSGIQALNDPVGTPYEGSTGNAINFARSSREPKTTSGNGCSNELTCDTFWGFAQDGIEVWALNNRAAEIQGLGGSALDPSNVLAKIFNCTFTTWDQVTGNAADAGQPIVVWGMNSSSGTYNVFRDYMRNPAGGNLPGYDPDSVGCITKLSNGTFPLENNLAPLIADKATSTSLTSVNNPENWIGWGSFGELSTFPFKNGGTSAATSVTYTGGDLPINGARPTPGNIGNNTWAIGRTLYHVTKNTDADCPQTTPGTCDFTGNPGPLITGTTHDLNVTGGSGGTSGAVREFTRFICRVNSAQQTKDPYTGVNNFTGITSGISKAGYQLVPSGLRNSGSRCHVVT
jgi:ABC-type phosphate transport system substrate-binding protein